MQDLDRGVTPLLPPFNTNLPSLARPYHLASLFRKLRLYHKLTIRQLAEKFAMSEKYISDVERGADVPSLLYCLLCAREFGANEEWVKRMWIREMVANFEEQLKKMIGIEG